MTTQQEYQRWRAKELVFHGCCRECGRPKEGADLEFILCPDCRKQRRDWWRANRTKRDVVAVG